MSKSRLMNLHRSGGSWSRQGGEMLCLTRINTDGQIKIDARGIIPFGRRTYPAFVAKEGKLLPCHSDFVYCKYKANTIGASATP